MKNRLAIQIPLVALILLSITSCSTNRMEDGKRVGYWIEKENRDGVEYLSKGSYRQGEETKRWRHYEKGKLIKKERYNGTSCTVTFYDAQGKKNKKGKTKLDGLHWFYAGEWKTYDVNGKLSGIMIYDKGELVRELDANRNEIPLTPLVYYTDLNPQTNTNNIK
ncbi:hypothetical protein [Flavobacterium sp. '19STA2R22 D10 B1']|uniref:hypothetical protein n=1 Tax=Flavobacterium aerium TaxID=3037261 RepID=UPI00278C26D9|nr:hypothetical protein [Flavobacterium sp. '19STA2R22 D10 B1']